MCGSEVWQCRKVHWWSWLGLLGVGAMNVRSGRGGPHRRESMNLHGAVVAWKQ
jgi:hypothetical protein